MNIDESSPPHRRLASSSFFIGILFITVAVNAMASPVTLALTALSLGESVYLQACSLVVKVSL